jgi:hypothetical protein
VKSFDQPFAGRQSLGYLSSGQPLTTLSGGERQRLKLATRLGDQGAQSAEVFVIDEPTLGLQLTDLFGVYSLWPREALDGVAGDAAPRLVVDFRILIPMLAYTAWHLGKPLPELWGTLVWGLVVSAIVLAIRSIWPIVAVHWLLNVWMDLVIWQGW